MRAFLVLALLPALLPAQAGTYTTFGAGCGGSDLGGWVSPTAAATAWGSSQNAFPFGLYNMRFQQEIDRSEMPTTGQVWTLMAAREDLMFPANQASTVALQVMFGTTTYANTSLTTTFATNATGAQTTVFQGTVSFPALPNGNSDLKKFHYVIKFAKPYVFIPLKTTDNFLIEIVNTNTTNVRRLPDVWQGTGANGARLWATTATATTGTLDTSYNLVLLFGNALVPALSNTGVPTINQAFSVDLDLAKAKSAAGLVLGASNTAWGPLNLPLDLTPAGAAGCSLLVSFDLLGVAATDATGKASLKLPVPNDSKLLGATFHNQFFVYDQRANPLGLAWSNGGSGKIGK